MVAKPTNKAEPLASSYLDRCVHLWSLTGCSVTHRNRVIRTNHDDFAPNLVGIPRHEPPGPEFWRRRVWPALEDLAKPEQAATADDLTAARAELDGLRASLQAAGGDCLLEVIIPRVSSGGSAAQFRVNAVPGQSMLSMYKAKRAREHMFVLRGRLTFLDNRALVELRHREADGELTVVFQARRVRAKDGGANNAWRVGFCHPLSAFQTFCILLALVAEKLDGE